MSFDPVAYKQAVTEEWGRAAQGWHKWIPEINAWLNLVTEAMLDQAGVKEGSRVIDIAAGDGGQSIAAAQRAGSSGEVLATDIAPEFVKLANAVASKMRLPQLRAEMMDAESLAIPNNVFDAAICRLGLMYLPNLQKGLSEIKRVLKPGGKMMCLEFSKPTFLPFRRLYDFYSFYIMPFLGELIAGSRKAYTHLPESIRMFPMPAELTALLKKIGFSHINYKKLTNGIAVIHLAIK